ncbi:hypothetical protein ACOSP7_025382 [Xanthoceras sorbifolium]
MDRKKREENNKIEITRNRVGTNGSGFTVIFIIRPKQISIYFFFFFFKKSPAMSINIIIVVVIIDINVVYLFSVLSSSSSSSSTTRASPLLLPPLSLPLDEDDADDDEEDDDEEDKPWVPPRCCSWLFSCSSSKMSTSCSEKSICVWSFEWVTPEVFKVYVLN